MSLRPDMNGWAMAYRLQLEYPTLLASEWRNMDRADRQAHLNAVHFELVKVCAFEGSPRAPLVPVRLHVRRGGNEASVPDQEIIGGLRPLLPILSAPRLRNPLGLGFIVDASTQYLQSITVEHERTAFLEGYTTIEIWHPCHQAMRAAA